MVSRQCETVIPKTWEIIEVRLMIVPTCCLVSAQIVMRGGETQKVPGEA